jgi:hypothetical protein
VAVLVNDGESRIGKAMGISIDQDFSRRSHWVDAIDAMIAKAGYENPAILLVADKTGAAEIGKDVTWALCHGLWSTAPHPLPVSSDTADPMMKIVDYVSLVMPVEEPIIRATVLPLLLRGKIDNTFHSPFHVVSSPTVRRTCQSEEAAHQFAWL